MIRPSLLSATSKWQIRHSEKLSIPMLAERTGLDKGFLYRFQNGEIQRLDLDKLATLCQFFACTPNDLLWVEDSSPDST